MTGIRIAIAVLALSSLVACGLKGGLEKPPPMWGEARAQYEADQRARAEAAAKEKAEKEKARQTTTVPVQSSSPVSNPASPPK